MITEAIKKILEINQPQKQIVNDRQYFDRKLYPVLEPEPVSLRIQTLTGIRDYMKASYEVADDPSLSRINIDGLMIHIVSYNLVELTSHLQGPFCQRPVFTRAQHDHPGFQFGQFMAMERFIISLQVSFVPTDTVAAILAIIGNIQDGIVKTHKDDGISQQITIKTGAATIEEAPVPNPVTLQPYRTFMEIEQPESLFILRLQPASGGGTPMAALFEADGGNWQLEAIQRIKAWLNDKLPDIPIIA